MRGNIVENESRLGLGSLGFGLWFFTQSVSDTFTSIITSRSIPLERPNPKDSRPKTQDQRPKPVLLSNGRCQIPNIAERIVYPCIAIAVGLIGRWQH